MRRWLEYPAVRYGLFQLAALGVNFLLQLPGHFIHGNQLFVWGLFFNQLPASALAIYALLHWVLPRLQRQPALFVGLLALWLPGSLLLTALIRASFDFVVAPRLLGQAPKLAFSWAEYLNPSSFTWFMMLVTAGTAATVEVMNEWYRQRQRQEQLVRRRLQAELQLLKTQLQPTFLFGTLRALHTLTSHKAREAPAAVLHLADLLRYQLYNGPRPTVPLADEVAMLRNYVALEQLRLGPRVEVSLNFSGSFSAHTVAPLLLLPLVENAFRHGTGPKLECPWVSIDLVARQNSVTLKIINSQRAAGATGKGDGLRCLRQRLDHLYPGRHELKILTEPDTFFVVLVLRLAPVPGGTLVPTADAAILLNSVQLAP